MILKSKIFWKRFSLSVGISFFLFFAVVIGMVLLSKTPSPLANRQNLHFERLATEQSKLPQLQHYRARDGQELWCRHYNSDGAEKTLILLHGSAYHSSYLASLASYLAEHNVANVYTPDMRGHGPRATTRGDVDYIGQVEDDISDLVNYVRKQENGPVLLGGHSSGGGTAIRYAGDTSNTAVDGYLLLAPYIHYSAPTYPKSGSAWTNVNTPRMIGLSILNTFGIKAFNHKDVISFNMPKAYRDETETLRYSYNLQISMHPRDDYGQDIASLDQPSFLMVGADDETFKASAYPPLFSKYSPTTKVRILKHCSHFGIVTEQTAHKAVADWMQATFPRPQPQHPH